MKIAVKQIGHIVLSRETFYSIRKALWKGLSYKLIKNGRIIIYSRVYPDYWVLHCGHHTVTGIGQEMFDTLIRWKCDCKYNGCIKHQSLKIRERCPHCKRGC